MTTEEFIEHIPFARGCEVIAWNELGLIAIYKKEGRATHPNSRVSSACVPMILARYNLDKEYYSWEKDETKMRLHLINRLDSPTSGILLAATSAELAESAKKAFAQKAVAKTYYAICVGRTPQKYGKWLDHIKETKSRNFVRGTATSGGKLASAKFEIEELDKNSAGLCLVRLEPETGLTHQLRIQCAKHKMPILGDKTYGNFQANKHFKKFMAKDRLFLHCAKTELEINFNGENIKFSAEAPIPQSFRALLEYNANIIRQLH